MSEPVYSTPYGFAALDSRLGSFEHSRFTVLPVPYEQTTTFVGGTKGGPEAIIRASRELELWDDELGAEPAEMGIHTRPHLEPRASGPTEMVDRISSAVGDLLAKGKIPALLGGEHTISVGAVRAVVKRHPELVAVVLDAHADFRDEYQGSSLSHACASRRISEHCPVVQAGVRSLSKEEAKLLRAREDPSIPANRIRTDPAWMSDVTARIKGKPVYLSVDLDVLDPGIMPSVGTPEPGGLGWSDLTGVIDEIAKRSPIVGFDVVELCPILGLIAPDFLAAKLVYKIIGYIGEALKGETQNAKRKEQNA